MVLVEVRRELKRCWETTDPQYNAYHDEEWGRPVTTEQGVYERLCLEGFQSGLSWITILRKREAFRAAFEGFDPERVARFGERDVERLLGDASIVRHRGKIEATIANARATVELRAAGSRCDELFWSHRPECTCRRAPSPRSPSSTPESAALSKACAGRASVSSARRPPTRPCRRAASSTTTSPTAGCGTPSRLRKRRGIRPDPSARLWVSAERRWSGVGDFKYGQWRYQLVEACPRDLTGIA